MKSLLSKSEPLYLPRGSVRAILALLIVAPVTVALLLSGMKFTSDQAIGLASLVLTAYFVSKAAAGKGSE
jgi:hypothetical protein